MKYKAILIIGQTASGKTAVAHKLFDTLHEKGIVCEIVNLDAFQIYKNVSIGTAKPSDEEQIKYKYHCIDLCAANESIDANVFAKWAQNACKDIYKRGHLPICVGGSGLYLRAFLHGLDPFPAHDHMIRQKIRAYAHENGWDKCYEWLAKVDPVRAHELHSNDHVRVERALEIFEITKMPASALQTKKENLYAQSTNFDSFVIHTAIDREELKKNILERTQELFTRGWIQEVAALYQNFGPDINHFNSMRAIGYKSILNCMLPRMVTLPRELGPHNSLPLCRVDEGAQGTAELIDSDSKIKLISQISNETAQYAKRQKTWNKKEKVDFLIHPTNNQEFSDLLEAAIRFIKN